MQTNTLQNEELKEQIVDSSHVLSQNHTNEQNHTIHSHITLFREIFCVDETINDSILEKQKRYFGFTLFILHTKTLYDALVLGVENGMREKKAKNHWIQYYLNSIFGQLFKVVMIIVLLIFIIISPSF
jgi:hypothetical protein